MIEEKEFIDLLGDVTEEFASRETHNPIDGNYVFAALSVEKPMEMRTQFDAVTFSAKDKFLPNMIITYITEIIKSGESDECILSAEALLDRVFAYQAEHGTELPSDTLK